MKPILEEKKREKEAEKREKRNWLLSELKK